MKVKITEATEKLQKLYKSQGADQSLTDWLTGLALEHELEGNRFSGFTDSGKNDSDLGAQSEIKLTYTVNKPALKLINANSKHSMLMMHDIFDNAVKWAREQGQIFIGFNNCGYQHSLSTIARKFAEVDLVCIYSGAAGPQGVVPYGGTKDIFGTNPIAYGIPTSDMPIVFDAATAQFAYGTIRLAKQRGEKLPAHTYFDDQGNYTTDPNKAESLIAFGGYKGYAINLLLEVMTGTMVGSKSGSLVTGESDLGGFLLLIDPSALGPLDEFKQQTSQMVKDIQNCPPAKGFTEVRVPGYRAQELRKKQLESGEIEIEDSVWADFNKLVGSL